MKYKSAFFTLPVFAASALILISAIIFGVTKSEAAANTKGYSWYCKHTEGDVPPLDSSMSFIEKYNAYYVDKNASEKTIYLTFDAGYENGNVAKTVDILKEHGVNGSFFILENIAEREPDLIKKMSDEGNLVCNHTALHRDMSSVSSKEEFEAELNRLNKAVEDSCGVEVAKFYRPPEGRFSEENLMWADELGYKTVFWSFAYPDWDNNKQPDPEKSFEKILKFAHPGEILLLHPTSSTNVKILGELIDTLKSQGYVFKTLDALNEK